MEMGKTTYENLYSELEAYERSGVCLLIDGNLASPMQVVRELMAKEAGSYMRDYELDPEGYIEKLSFININGKEKDDTLQNPFIADVDPMDWKAYKDHMKSKNYVNSCKTVNC